MCEQALFIYKHASQVEGTNMAKCSAYNEQFWVLQVPAAGLCMQEAIGKLLRHRWAAGKRPLILNHPAAAELHLPSQKTRVWLVSCGK